MVDHAESLDWELHMQRVPGGSYGLGGGGSLGELVFWFAVYAFGFILAVGIILRAGEKLRVYQAGDTWKILFWLIGWLLVLGVVLIAIL
jgi:hypothetical protein